MVENKEQFNVDQEVEMTLHRIRELDMRYQAIMAGQGHGFDEDETVDEMEQMGMVRVTDAEDAQRDIIRQARKLQDAGEIILASADGGGFV